MLQKISRYLLTPGIIAITFFGVQWWQTRDLKKGNLPVALNLVTLNGKPLNLDSSRKKLLYFFAPWCTVCKLNIENLNDLSGIQAIAVALDYQSNTELVPFQKKLQVPIALGSPETARQFRVSAFPTLYFLSEDNRVISTAVGYTTSIGMWLRSL